MNCSVSDISIIHVKCVPSLTDLMYQGRGIPRRSPPVQRRRGGGHRGRIVGRGDQKGTSEWGVT